MSEPTRRIPGQSVMKRIASRMASRPRIGASASFYKRFGLDDPWSSSEVWSGFDEESPFFFLSSAHYYRALRRRAAARARVFKRMQERVAREQSRFEQRLRMRSRLPGDKPAMPRFTPGLGASEMVVPVAATEAPVEEESSSSRSAWSGAPRVRTTVRQVLVREASRSTNTPVRGEGRGMDRAASRSTGGTSRVSRALDAAEATAIGGQRRQIRALRTVIEQAPAEEQQVRIVRAARRVRGPASVYLQELVEQEREAPESSRARPTAVARTRMTARAEASSGSLRPVLRSSPTFSILAPARPEPQQDSVIPAAVTPRRAVTRPAAPQAATAPRQTVAPAVREARQQRAAGRAGPEPVVASPESTRRVATSAATPSVAQREAAAPPASTAQVFRTPSRRATASERVALRAVEADTPVATASQGRSIVRRATVPSVVPVASAERQVPVSMARAFRTPARAASATVRMAQRAETAPESRSLVPQPVRFSPARKTDTTVTVPGRRAAARLDAAIEPTPSRRRVALSSVPTSYVQPIQPAVETAEVASTSTPAARRATAPARSTATPAARETREVAGARSVRTPRSELVRSTAFRTPAGERLAASETPRRQSRRAVSTAAALARTLSVPRSDEQGREMAAPVAVPAARPTAARKAVVRALRPAPSSEARVFRTPATARAAQRDGVVPRTDSRGIALSSRASADYARVPAAASIAASPVAPAARLEAGLPVPNRTVSRRMRAVSTDSTLAAPVVAPETSAPIAAQPAPVRKAGAVAHAGARVSRTPTTRIEAAAPAERAVRTLAAAAPSAARRPTQDAPSESVVTVRSGKARRMTTLPSGSVAYAAARAEVQPEPQAAAAAPARRTPLQRDAERPQRRGRPAMPHVSASSDFRWLMPSTPTAEAPTSAPRQAPARLARAEASERGVPSYVQGVASLTRRGIASKSRRSLVPSLTTLARPEQLEAAEPAAAEPRVEFSRRTVASRTYKTPARTVEAPSFRAAERRVREQLASPTAARSWRRIQGGAPMRVLVVPTAEAVADEGQQAPVSGSRVSRTPGSVVQRGQAVEGRTAGQVAGARAFRTPRRARTAAPQQTPLTFEAPVVAPETPRSVAWAESRAAVEQSQTFGPAVRSAPGVRSVRRAFAGAPGMGASPVDAIVRRSEAQQAGPITARARVFKTPAGTFEPAARPATRLGRRPTNAWSGSMSLPQSHEPLPAIDPQTGEPVSREQAFVGGASPDRGLPRSTARTVRTSGNLLTALARAGRPEEVVRVILERQEGIRDLSRSLPSPAVQLIERIVKVSTAEEQTVLSNQTRESRLGTPVQNAPVVKGAVRRRTSRSTARSFSGNYARGDSGSASTSVGGGSTQVMKLAKKLQSLIHLAEVERRKADAQKQVRMAETGAEATAEGSQGSPGGDDMAQTVNIKALQRDVLEAVLRELDLMQRRRQEEPDGRNIWW